MAAESEESSAARRMSLQSLCHLTAVFTVVYRGERGAVEMARSCRSSNRSAEGFSAHEKRPRSIFKPTPEGSTMLIYVHFSISRTARSALNSYFHAVNSVFHLKQVTIATTDQYINITR